MKICCGNSWFQSIHILISHGREIKLLIILPNQVNIKDVSVTLANRFILKDHHF